MATQRIRVHAVPGRLVQFPGKRFQYVGYRHATESETPDVQVRNGYGYKLIPEGSMVPMGSLIRRELRKGGLSQTPVGKLASAADNAEPSSAAKKTGSKTSTKKG